MLPSLFFKFKNVGIPPPLRSLLIIHPSLSPNIAVQLRFRLRIAARPLLTSSSNQHSGSRQLHTSTNWSSEAASSVPSSSSLSPSSAEVNAMDTQEPRLQLTFTCTAPNCSERSTHSFTKRAYESGIVLVTCPGCKNRYVLNVS